MMAKRTKKDMKEGDFVVKTKNGWYRKAKENEKSTEYISRKQGDYILIKNIKMPHGKEKEV